MRAVSNVATFAVTIIGAALIGFGIPLGWVWIGSQLEGGSGASNTSFSVAMAILFGIILSYVAVLYLAGVAMAFLDHGNQRGPATSKSPWMRGQSDTRQANRRETVNSIERIFIITTITVTVAFWLWFAFKAGSPLPNQ